MRSHQLGFLKAKLDTCFTTFRVQLRGTLTTCTSESIPQKRHNRECSDGENLSFQGYLAESLEQYQSDADKFFSAVAKHMGAYDMASYLHLPGRLTRWTCSRKTPAPAGVNSKL